MSIRRIGLDCEPCTPRPDSYIEEVIEGTPLKEGKIVSKLFGAWIWEFEIDEEEWDKIEPTICERIEKLYADNKIRGGVHTKRGFKGDAGNM